MTRQMDALKIENLDKPSLEERIARINEIMKRACERQKEAFSPHSPLHPTLAERMERINQIYARACTRQKRAFGYSSPETKENPPKP